MVLKMKLIPNWRTTYGNHLRAPFVYKEGKYISNLTFSFQSSIGNEDKLTNRKRYHLYQKKQKFGKSINTW